MNEDVVRTKMSKQLGFAEIPVVNGGTDLQQGVGQQTTFKMLGFDCKDSNYRPDGWYLPKDTNEIAIICEAKSSDKDITNSIECDKQIEKYIAVVKTKYKNVVGILYNGEDVNVYKNSLSLSLTSELKNKEYYIKLIKDKEQIDKPKIYRLTKTINDTLHIELNIKNLYHRMIFTATSIVAIYFDNDGCLKKLKNIPSYEVFKRTISEFLKEKFKKDNERFEKIENLLEVFDGIKPNIDNCISCGTQNNIVTISSYKGGLLCKDCISNEKIYNIKTIKLIRMFYYVDLNKITKLDISPNIKKELNLFINDYYDRYSGLYLKSKTFLEEFKSLKEI